MYSERAAGTTGRPSGSTKDCLKFEERPLTPPEIAKFRRSNALNSGHRFQSDGTTDDNMTRRNQDLTYGVATDRGNNTAASLIGHQATSELDMMKLYKAEKVYRSQAREPLGRTMDRGNVLPGKFTRDNQPFGIASVPAIPAKDVIFPVHDDQNSGAEDVYRKSHGAIGPGEQISRGYDWHGADMSKKIFGIKGNSLAYNGVSVNVAEALKGGCDSDHSSSITLKRLEDFRSSGDHLGQVKNLGQHNSNRPADMPFGRPSVVDRTGGRPRLSAKEVMRGTYVVEDDVSDMDRGRSSRPGTSRDGTGDGRTFGCPSIRSDLCSTYPRSLANSLNYGDDVSAHHLINPPQFSDLNISSNALDEPKDRYEIQSLFSKIGYDLQPDLFEVMFTEASRGAGAEECSVNQFRDVLNDYLSARDFNRDND